MSECFNTKFDFFPMPLTPFKIFLNYNSLLGNVATFSEITSPPLPKPVSFSTPSDAKGLVISPC